MKAEINTKVENGQLKKNRGLIVKALQQFEGKEIVLKIERKRKKRSNQQNAYYWGCVVEMVKNGIIEATGDVYSSDDIHYQILLPKFGASRELTNTTSGEVLEVKKSSSALTTTEFMEYIMRIQKFASEFLGVYIPDPNEQIEMEIND